MKMIGEGIKEQMLALQAALDAEHTKVVVVLSAEEIKKHGDVHHGITRYCYDCKKGRCNRDPCPFEHERRRERNRTRKRARERARATDAETVRHRGPSASRRA